MSATFPSTSRYIGFATQDSLGTPATDPTIVIPATKSQSSMRWDMNLQDQEYNTGDNFILVDSIPVKPLASGTIVTPFKPHVLNDYYAMTGYVAGPIGTGSWLTVFIGDGYNEKVYSDVRCTTGTMSCDDNSGPASWSHQFMGLHPSVAGTVRDPADVAALFPAYEKAFTLTNLQTATLLGTAGQVNIEAIQWYYTTGITPYYGSKGDNTLGPSDLIINRQGATMSITRAAYNDLLRVAYINNCGAPGNWVTKFLTACGTTYSHQWTMPNGLIDTYNTEAPDDLPINEPFTVKGLRVSGGSPAVVTIAIV